MQGKSPTGMLDRLLLRASFLVPLVLSGLSGPALAQTPSAKNAANTEKKAAEPKLTKQQQRGLRLLQSAQAEAAALQPDMRAYVLMEVANGYQKVDPSKADALLKDAFMASFAIEDIAPASDDRGEQPCPYMQGCGIKIGLQEDILMAMSSLHDVETLLLRAQPEVQHQVTESLISQYATKKNFERAKELIASLASQGDYPYGSAMQLMGAMPRTATSERVAIFVQALNAHREQGDTTRTVNGFEGMSGMVMRFWHHVPPALAVDAIDQILEQAKDASAGPNNVHLTYSGNAGTVALSSWYQYRLFQLLPVLQELDKPKAESLLRDNPDLRAMLDRFPEGFQAVHPDYALHPPKKGDIPISSMSVSTGDAPPSASFALELQAEDEIERREQRIIAESETDPRQAVADAMSLSEVPQFPDQTCPRAGTLIRIAWKLGNKNPSVTKDALAGVRKSLSQSSLTAQARSLGNAAEEYLEIGDEDDAHKTVEEALQVAEKLYAKDTDNEDPNQAFKGTWSSTQLWQRCVQITARFSPSAAEAIVSNIKDPEIATFEKIYFASSLLGASPKRF